MMNVYRKPKTPKTLIFCGNNKPQVSAIIACYGAVLPYLIFDVDEYTNKKYFIHVKLVLQHIHPTQVWNFLFILKYH